MDYLTHSNDHYVIKQRLEEFAESCDSLETLARLLHKARIYFEDIRIGGERQFLVFTGSSGYDIVGCCIKIEEGEIVVEDLY